MKRKSLTLILIFIATVTFAQVPKHQRVLHYVPDSCYSLTLFNLDTLAKVMELEALHTEKVLKPLYDSLKFSKKLVQSWIKRDNKLGIDFTATAAMADSRYYFLPLNNEKNFEKMVRSLDKSLPPFETMTDAEGRKFRCMTISSEYDYGTTSALICTEDVACFVTLTDMNAVYYSQPTVVEGTDSVDWDGWLNRFLKTETPMQVWDRLSHSKFASSETATAMLTQGWDSYTAYKQGNYLLKTISGAIAQLVPASAELQKAVSEFDLEIFSRGEAHHDRLTSYSEFRSRNEHPNALKTSPEAVKRLLPYVAGDYMGLVISTMEGCGDFAEPYAGSMKEWGLLLPLLNKPFVFTLSALDENSMMLATVVEHPEEVRGILERYVAASNHITDSTYKARKNMVVEEVVEETLEEPVVREEEVSKEPVENKEEYVELATPFWEEEDAADSTIGMKTLVYQKIDGWDAYIILTNKKEMDYETYTQVVKEDSSCVLMKGDLLFYVKSLGALPSLSQPLEREWPKEYFEHYFYARADFASLVAILGPEAAMPIRDFVIAIDKQSATMNVNAEPGLRHGVLFETVKYIIDILKNFNFD